MIILAIVSAVLGTVAITNRIENKIRQAWLMPYAEATIEQCETDGLLECHTEWVYDGIVLVGFDTVGKEASHE